MPAPAGYIAAEAVHAVTHQGALDLDDILARRTRVSIEAADRGRAAAAAIAPLVAPELGWSEARAAEELDRYLRLRDAEEAAEAAPDDAAAAAAYARSWRPRRGARPVGEPQQPALREPLGPELARRRSAAFGR